MKFKFLIKQLFITILFCILAVGITLSFVILPGFSSVNNNEVNNYEKRVAGKTVKKSSSRVDYNLTNNLEIDNQISLSDETIAILEDNISDIDSEMKKLNTEVTNELTKCIEKYESLIDDNMSTEEYEKIQDLIHITEQLNLAYQEYKSTSNGYDMNVSRITKYVYTYLNISNSGKSGGAWKIKVTNPFNYKLKVYYNTKMCNEGDAKEWKGLKDESYITLEAYQSKTVNISTNWFATSVALSYIANDGVRVITYANGLGADGSINVMTNYIN